MTLITGRRDGPGPAKEVILASIVLATKYVGENVAQTLRDGVRLSQQQKSRVEFCHAVDSILEDDSMTLGGGWECVLLMLQSAAETAWPDPPGQRCVSRHTCLGFPALRSARHEIITSSSRCPDTVVWLDFPVHCPSNSLRSACGRAAWGNPFHRLLGACSSCLPLLLVQCAGSSLSGIPLD